MAEFKRHADTVRRDWASAASITLASAQ
jgi:hypothetical protein